MKITETCVPCLIKRIIFEANLSTNNIDKKNKAITEALRILSNEYDTNNVSSTIATHVHHRVYEILEDMDPYGSLKEKSNNIALSLIKKADELIKKDQDPLKMSMLCAIAGNTMDFGIEGGNSKPEVLAETFELLIKEGLGYDDSGILKNLLSKSKNIIIFTDNCGEIVFDKLLFRELRYAYPNLHSTLVVKGEPVLSDATMKDAVDFDLASVVDEVFTTGCFAVGVDFDQLPPLARERLDVSDLIICKGMANFEAFSETTYSPIAYLLRSKCRPIADAMDVPLNKNIIKVYQ
jgi:uncharacterized protein with ATP-grasp and redox domains